MLSLVMTDNAKRTNPYSYTEGTCTIDTEHVNIQVWRNGYKEPAEKCVQKKNPVALLREGRNLPFLIV